MYNQHHSNIHAHLTIVLNCYKVITLPTLTSMVLVGDLMQIPTDTVYL